MRQKFDITGMSCAACSAHIDKAVRKLHGVKDVTVNLLSNSMQVEFNEKEVSVNDIENTVVSAGYGACPIGKNQFKEVTSLQKDPAIIELESMKTRLIVSFLFFLPLMYIAMGHMVRLPIPSFLSGMNNALMFALTQFILLLPIAYVNRKYFITGFKSMKSGSPNMDSLIAIGAGAAILYGVFAIYKIAYAMGLQDSATIMKYHSELYFESAATILTLITLGKFFEARSKNKTGDAIKKLINMSPKTAIVERNGEQFEINASDIKHGEIVVAKQGASIAADGVVISGFAAIDESVITGESMPVEKSVGSNVIAATINKSGFLRFQAQKVGEDTAFAQIIKLVEEAANSKAPISKLADKISGVFVPSVIIIAICSSLIWLIAGHSFEFALSIGISVLVISCPCALGLATPVAIMVGTGKAAENGILIKSAEALETAHKINMAIIDKTGTITLGKPSVTEIFAITDMANRQIIEIAASIESSSDHPIAKAIVNKAHEEGIKLLPTENFASADGRGVFARLGDKSYTCGNNRFMEDNNIDLSGHLPISESLSAEGKTPVFLASGKNLVAILGLSDTVKPESISAIEVLRKMKINTIMLTGDNKATAEAIAKIVNPDRTFAGVLPQDKEEIVREYQSDGKVCVMIGDGINDAPALARADVGIAIGAGTDVAIDAADIVLVRSNLLDAVSAIELSRAVIKNIKTNLFWAFFYNTLGIPIAAGILYPVFGIKLNPMIAAAAMSASSVCVVLNALRLRLFKPTFKQNDMTNKSEVKNIMEKTIKIDGMSCNHCKASVEKALKSLSGVTNAEVNLEKKQAIVKSEKSIPDDVFTNAIEEAGFKVVSIK